MTNKEWFKKAQFGMMIHWGLYSLPAGEWKGERMEDIGEWLQQYFRIPNAEYHKLAKAFNPILFDAEEWVKLARDAGMKYIVFTAKHHEGFAMYKSEVSPFNIVDATPFKRDVLKELSDACRKYDMKLGLYYSQEIDWSEKNGGGYNMGKTWCGGKAYWTNNWDFPEDDRKDFSECFENKIKPQVKEILTGYGDLCLVWFDCPMTLTLDQSRELYSMVREYQPDCLINSRIGNGMYDYVSFGDNEIPDEIPAEADAQNLNTFDGFKPSPYGLYETAATLNDTWGYSAHDHNWKTPEQIAAIRRKLRSIGANYLLNVGPDGLGRIPGKSVDILRAAGRAEPCTR